MKGRLECLTSKQLALLVPAVALALSEGLSDDEIDVFGAFLCSVGDLMVLLVAQNVLAPEQ